MHSHCISLVVGLQGHPRLCEDSRVVSGRVHNGSLFLFFCDVMSPLPPTKNHLATGLNQGDINEGLSASVCLPGVVGAGES